MARTTKHIYLCTCLSDLQKEAGKTSKAVETHSAKKLISSAEKLLAEGEASYLEGDEELSYVYFCRYIEAVTSAQKKDDYKKDKAFYDKLLPPKTIHSAFEKLEKITNSLQKRYAFKKEIENADSVAREKEISDALQQLQQKNRSSGTKDEGSLSSGDGVKSSLSNINGVIKTNGVDGPRNGGITPHELKTLLEQKTKRFLLVDCRDKQDFIKNHINHSNCICIPATILERGMSANRILNILKDHNPESYMDWEKRGTYDHIILYDWNSTYDNRQSSLGIVYDALTQWDTITSKTSILVVQGGMKTMYYTYPMKLTNPQSQTVNSANNKANGSSVDLPAEVRALDSISYPDEILDETPPKKQINSEPREITVNNSNNTDVPSRSTSTNHPSASISADVHNVPKNTRVIAVDRSTKPTRLGSSHQIIPNGNVQELAKNFDEKRSVVEDKTDEKMKEYSQALDGVIESISLAIKIEQDIGELRELEKTLKEPKNDFETTLKSKEAEAEYLTKRLVTLCEDLKGPRSEFEGVVQHLSSKQSLPRLRTTAAEDQIREKEKKKKKLSDVLMNLRRQNKEAEERIKKLIGEKAAAAENAAKFPPIPNNNASVAPARNTSANGATTQLPIIKPTNPVVPPASTKPISGTSGISSAPSPSSSLRTPSQNPSSLITRQKLKDENSELPRSSALKRSHSHPNIAQSHDEDMGDEHSSVQAPRINRGLKPSGGRAHHTEARRFARNFEVVSSTEKSKTGLKNLGNTCYMNSIIQCLSHTVKLVEYLRTEEYLKEWHPSRSPTRGEATEELAAAVNQMHSGHRSISLLDLKATVGKHHPSFRGYEQQDSHEFVTIFLDWLNEEMNRVLEKIPIEEQKNDGLSDEVAAGKAWDEYQRSHNSKISELFCGQQKSCVTCGSCKRSSVTFEPFYILSVPIPSLGKKCDIQQCIDFYTSEEEVGGWNCVHCKTTVRATKKIDLWRLPPYLIIHFQRFYFDGYWKKRLTEIDFPVENLDLQKKVLGRNNDKCPNEYQLYGVSNHYGTMDGGHYTAYCRSGHTRSWVKFDDQEVSPISERDVPTANAYIMFYQNRHC